jgi:hypothetical protein
MSLVSLRRLQQRVGKASCIASPRRAADRIGDQVSPQAIAKQLRRLPFLTVYYGSLPIGHAQARLAQAFRQTGVGLGWPLLVLWWPLRQIYALSYRICLALRP